MKRPKRMNDDAGAGESSCGGSSCGCGPFPADVPESERFTGPSPTLEEQERIASGGLGDASAENPVRDGTPPMRWGPSEADVGAPVKNLRD